MRRGFTLIELMIVIVILGILAAIAIPKFSDVKADSEKSACRSNMRNLATGVNLYFADRNEYPRKVTEIDCVVENASIMRCPSFPESGSSNPDHWTPGNYWVYGYSYTWRGFTYSYYYSVCCGDYYYHGYIYSGMATWELGWTPE